MGQNFYAEMLNITGLDAGADGVGPLPEPGDRASWPGMRQRLAAIMKTKSRDEWCTLLEGTDACFAPVLTMDEAPQHPHMAERRTFIDVGGVVQPAPAPRLSRTPGEVAGLPPRPGQDTVAALGDWGFSTAEIAELRDTGAVR
ncbi:MAG: CoA transferase [Acidimicrobiales bacterium]